MNENDYIAEYVKEKYPKLISGADFMFWKITKGISETVKAFCDSVKNIAYITKAEDPEFEDDEEDKEAADGDN